MEYSTILIVDGYNMIGSWPELDHLKQRDEIQAARDLLLFELSNYSKYRGYETIVVFDAQYVEGRSTSYEEYELQVVFTGEDETADEYIERSIEERLSPLNRVIVATSDATEQWLVFQKGALRQSADELRAEINYSKQMIRQEVERHYDSSLRRRSPWKIHQMQQLNNLLEELEKESEE